MSTNPSEAQSQKKPKLLDQIRAAVRARHNSIRTVEEAQSVLVRLQGTVWLMPNLLYGSGLRSMECIRLRVKDIDFQEG